MDWKPSKEHFRWVLDQEYTHHESNLDYCIIQEGDILTVLFQETRTNEDWSDNFNFYPEPFDIFPGSSVLVHRGIAKQYMSARDEILNLVYSGAFKTVRTTGYSLGCGLCQLFTYDLAWHVERDHLDVKVDAIGYSGPRVFCPHRNVKRLMKKYGFLHIRNHLDPVVHAPFSLMPTFFYFQLKPFKIWVDWKAIRPMRLTRWSHVGKHIWMGSWWPLPCKHLSTEIEKSLLEKFGG